MKTIKVRALRPLQAVGRTIHPGEHFAVTVDEAAKLVERGDAAYQPGDEPKPAKAKAD